MKKILVANRGEIACRIFQTCREMGIQSVAVYSDIDAHSPFVRQADEAYALGGETAQESYLNIPKLLEIAKKAGVDGIHPGYGFLSENADFARRCEAAGIIFIGPTAEVIALMGDKLASKASAIAAGVPVIPGWEGDASTMTGEDWLRVSTQIGFPILVKAAAGGGGKGMRRVNTEAELLAAIDAASREAQKAFNDGRIFLERYIENPRHVEVQILADTHGNVLHLFDRDCSTQRRHQKVLEEAPAPNLPEATRQKLYAAAVNLSRSVNYRGAGTVEFIVDNDHPGAIYFLEMNTRLQVEHPVTEWISGIDLVREQIQIARGEVLQITQANCTPHGHAIEARIYAEDPDNNFLPATGKLEKLTFPTMPWLRIDTGVTQGDTVSMFYDPMIAKISAWGPTREEALQRLISALEQTIILGTSLKSNVAFLIAMLNDSDFKTAALDTHIVDRFMAAQETTAAITESSELLALVALLEATTTTHEQKAMTLAARETTSPWQTLLLNTVSST